jgi:hypothetical protein
LEFLLVASKALDLLICDELIRFYIVLAMFFPLVDPKEIFVFETWLFGVSQWLSSWWPVFFQLRLNALDSGWIELAEVRSGGTGPKSMDGEASTK